MTFPRTPSVGCAVQSRGARCRVGGARLPGPVCSRARARAGRGLGTRPGLRCGPRPRHPAGSAAARVRHPGLARHGVTAHHRWGAGTRPGPGPGRARRRGGGGAARVRHPDLARHGVTGIPSVGCEVLWRGARCRLGVRGAAGDGLSPGPVAGRAWASAPRTGCASGPGLGGAGLRHRPVAGRPVSVTPASHPMGSPRTPSVGCAVLSRGARCRLGCAVRPVRSAPGLGAGGARPRPRPKARHPARAAARIGPGFGARGGGAAARVRHPDLAPWGHRAPHRWGAGTWPGAGPGRGLRRPGRWRGGPCPSPRPRTPWGHRAPQRWGAGTWPARGRGRAWRRGRWRGGPCPSP